ncbi:hypothetical protein MXB_1882 [Myxobolus squamalis]|nr:hypothetical protein MXB_1882 [Myxobolus squamalis]
MCMPDELRNARERMQCLFPLTEQLWVDWLEDEIKLSSDDFKNPYIIDLFEKAVIDYQSVKIWLLYTQYLMDVMQNESEIEDVRKLFERAIIAAGLHLTQGSSIWDGYIDFEINILKTLQESPAKKNN